MGTTNECFHTSGKIPVTIEVFRMQVRKEMITRRDSLKYFSGTPFAQCEFLVSKFLIINIILLLSGS